MCFQLVLREPHKSWNHSGKDGGVKGKNPDPRMLVCPVPSVYPDLASRFDTSEAMKALAVDVF